MVYRFDIPKLTMPLNRMFNRLIEPEKNRQATDLRFKDLQFIVRTERAGQRDGSRNNSLYSRPSEQSLKNPPVNAEVSPMSIPPIDGHEYPINPFEKSRLFRLASMMQTAGANKPGAANARPGAEGSKNQPTFSSRSASMAQTLNSEAAFPSRAWTKGPTPSALQTATSSREWITQSRAAQNAAFPSRQWNVTAETEAQQSTFPSRYAEGSHFEISTRQILNLIQKYRLENMTFDQLNSIPLSQLGPNEREFVNFLRRNRDIFDRISELDHQPGISGQDVKIAAQLSGDGLVLSNEDLNYLRQAAPLPATPQPAFVRDAQTRTPRLQTQDLLNILDRLNPNDPNGIAFEDLQALSARNTGLQGRELEALRFLQTTTVSKVLEKVVQPYDGQITPDALRVLTSLLWNPSIYGAAPIVFHPAAGHGHEIDEEIHEVDEVDEVDDDKHDQRTARRKLTFRLQASRVLDIIHNLSDTGSVTLDQLQHYEPRNPAEEKVANLLRQANVFHALAGMDRHPDRLTEKDVLLALSQGRLVLSDPYMVLLILP